MTIMAALLFSLALLLRPSSGALAEEECSLNTEQLAHIHINGSSGEEEELELRMEFSPTALKLEAMNIALKVVKTCNVHRKNSKMHIIFDRTNIRANLSLNLTSNDLEFGWRRRNSTAFFEMG